MTKIIFYDQRNSIAYFFTNLNNYGARYIENKTRLRLIVQRRYKVIAHTWIILDSNAICISYSFHSPIFSPSVNTPGQNLSSISVDPSYTTALLETSSVRFICILYQFYFFRPLFPSSVLIIPVFWTASLFCQLPLSIGHPPLDHQ